MSKKLMMNNSNQKQNDFEKFQYISSLNNATYVYDSITDTLTITGNNWGRIILKPPYEGGKKYILSFDVVDFGVEKNTIIVDINKDSGSRILLNSSSSNYNNIISPTGDNVIQIAMLLKSTVVIKNIKFKEYSL